MNGIACWPSFWNSSGALSSFRVILCSGLSDMGFAPYGAFVCDLSTTPSRGLFLVPFDRRHPEFALRFAGALAKKQPHRDIETEGAAQLVGEVTDVAIGDLIGSVAHEGKG